MNCKDNKNRRLNTLQKICFPSFGIFSEELLYFRLGQFTTLSLKNKTILFLKEGAFFTSDTFFNAFNVKLWKKYCNIKDLFLIVEGEGTFILQFGLHRLDFSHRWLQEEELILNRDTPVTIPLNFWEELEDGLLYYKIFLKEGKGIIRNIEYATSTPPAEKVKLGIVITHYNRKNYVVPAIKRIQEWLNVQIDLKNNVELIVVDNSKNITSEESYGATIIPNENYGGSGGSARGLLYCKDNEFTHCIFMDDDASCELESIRRVYKIFSYSKIERLAISGILLRNDEIFRVYEKAAIFDGLWNPLKQGLDMRNVFDLLLAEHDFPFNKKGLYGAWPFFAFRIKDVKHFPFPFFVRGDDILFSLQNEFNICAFVGISAWIDDFAEKESPIVKYLVTRSTLVLWFYLKLPLRKIIKHLLLFILHPLMSYLYSSSQASILALEHFMSGSRFWIDNLNISKIRKEINSYVPSEKLEEFYLPNLAVDFPDSNKLNQENKIRKFARYITSNGFLLPNFLLKNRVIYLRKH